MALIGLMVLLAVRADRAADVPRRPHKRRVGATLALDLVSFLVIVVLLVAVH